MEEVTWYEIEVQRIIMSLEERACNCSSVATIASGEDRDRYEGCRDACLDAAGKVRELLKKEG